MLRLDKHTTTVGTWNSVGREVRYRGEKLHWNKRREWLQYLIFRPSRASFEMAMDVWKMPDDSSAYATWLENHRASDRVTRSDRYRDYLKSSRGEFYCCKGNECASPQWLVQRAKLLLPCCRGPVITQDTGFGDVLPLDQGCMLFVR